MQLKSLSSAIRADALYSHYDWLALPHDIDHAPNEAVAQHPHREQWHKMGKSFKEHFHIPRQEERDFDGERYFKAPHGTCQVQVCRSVSDWSHGVLLERSIQSACAFARGFGHASLTCITDIQLIREASHTIYIENQFLCDELSDELDLYLTVV